MNLKHLTIDTNVIEHANNDIEERKEFSYNFLLAILNSNLKICIDFQKAKGFNLQNSIIWNEYNNRITSQSFGKIFLQTILIKKRIFPVKRDVNQREKKISDRLIPKPVDRTFLRVAYNSESKIFISHDFEDFSLATRNKLFEEMIVSIKTAKEFLDN
jgi:predicted nucleic acid-binding protein